MKKSFITFLVLGLTLSCFAKLPPLFPENKYPDLKPIKGGEDGKNYAVILSSGLSKEELINKTVEVLKIFEIVDSTYIIEAELSEELTEFSLSTKIRVGICYEKGGAMGVKTIYPPVILDVDTRFEFYDNGKLMIVFENLREKSLHVVSPDKEKTFHWYKNGKEPEAYEEYQGHASAVAMGNSFITKILVVINKGIDGYAQWNAAAKDYLNDINKEFDICDKLVDSKYGEWLSDPEVIEYTEVTKASGYKYEAEIAKTYYDQGRLLLINETRWKTNVSKTFDIFFKSIANNLNSQIEGVAEDGEQTWINIDGKVLPVDKKKQQEYVKKNLEY